MKKASLFWVSLLPKMEKIQPTLILEPNPSLKVVKLNCMNTFQKKTVYPKKAQKNNTEGRVVIRFWVDIDGSLVDPEILSKSDPLLNEAALKVIKNMPKWIPGKQEGILVKVSFVLPFDFKLDQ